MASQRRQHVEGIMEACQNDRQFYQLIRKQRQVTTSAENAMTFGTEKAQGDELLESWAGYFENLATPKDLPQFDDEHKTTVMIRNLLIKERTCENQQEPITKQMVNNSIKN